MTNIHRHFMLAAAVAAGLAIVMPIPQGAAQNAQRGTESATVPTNPGFDADSGQINPGRTLQAPSSSDDIRKIPTHAEAVAALMAPDDPTPSLGHDVMKQASQDKPTAPADAGGSDPATASQGMAVVGGSLAPGASLKSPTTTTPATAEGKADLTGGQQHTSQEATRPETTGLRPADRDSDSGPIGATGQTMPAKFSKRNDILDRLPIMAWPMRLTAEERQRIYEAVAADKAPPTAGADALAPASILSTEQALNGTHALPESVRDMDQLKGVRYVKAKDKVLLITPATRIVVEEITPQAL